MSKLAKLKSHLTIKQVEDRYRAAEDVTSRNHWHIIWLRAQKKSTHEVAKVTGFKDDWIRRLVRRYNECGPDSLGDLRRFNRGQQPVLGPRLRRKLLVALQGRAPDGGLWSGPKVARWVAAKTGTELSNKGGWAYLRRLGMTVQLPRPRHPKASSADHADFKKNSADGSERCARSFRGQPLSSGRRTKPVSD